MARKYILWAMLGKEDLYRIICIYNETMINTDLFFKYYTNRIQIVLWDIYIAKDDVTVTFKYDWFHLC